jgi:hypothetical protein
MEYIDVSKLPSNGGESVRRERLIRTAREHLELALECDDQPSAQYHIRAALQALVIETEGRPN